MTDAVRPVTQGLKRLLDGINRGGLVEFGGLLLRVSFLKIVIPEIVGHSDPSHGFPFTG
jgi:hypothetical protein